MSHSAGYWGHQHTAVMYYMSKDLKKNWKIGTEIKANFVMVDFKEQN